MRQQNIDMIKEKFIDELLLWELNNLLQGAEDPVIINSLHNVIAYCEGASDE